MTGMYGSFGGPRRQAMTAEDFWQSAYDQPLSLGTTLLDQAKGGVLSSNMLGTAIKEFTVPEGEPTTGDNIRSALRLANPLTTGYEVSRRAVQAFREESPTLSQDAYKASAWFRDGIPWDAGMTEARAQALAVNDDARKVREYYAEKRPITAFIGSLAGQAVDPINYVPVAGPAVKAAAAYRFGRVGGAALAASLDAAGNTALAGLATRDIRRQHGDNVSWQATVSEIATAALIGAAFGTIGGAWEARGATKARRAVTERLSTLKTTQEARIALNEAIDAVVRGEDVSLTPNATEPMARVADEVAIVDRPKITEPAPIDLFVKDSSVASDVPTLGGITDKWDERGISGFVSERADMITVSKIVVPEPERGKGIGTAAMRELADYADAKGKSIALTPSADFGGSKKRLESFYKNLGFLPNKGKNKDFSTSETLIRPPKLQPKIEASAKPKPLLPADSSLNRTASWVIRDKATGKPVMETFDPSVVEKVNTAKYEAVPIGQYLGEINGRPKPTVDTTRPAPEPLPEGRAQAETRIGKPDDFKALSAQYGVDPNTGAFVEEAEIAQLGVEGRLTEDDVATLAEAQDAYDNSVAYGEALKAAVNCLL